MQRYINKKLQLFKAFAQAFIDNIIVFLKIAIKHLYYLYKVFTLFAEIGLSLLAKKSFFAYLLV
jgi:hypothetical protein